MNSFRYFRCIYYDNALGQMGKLGLCMFQSLTLSPCLRVQWGYFLIKHIIESGLKMNIPGQINNNNNAPEVYIACRYFHRTISTLHILSLGIISKAATFSRVGSKFQNPGQESKPMYVSQAMFSPRYDSMNSTV